MTQNALLGAAKSTTTTTGSKKGGQHRDWTTDHPKTDNHHWQRARQPDLPVGTAGRLWLESNLLVSRCDCLFSLIFSLHLLQTSLANTPDSGRLAV